MAIIQKTIEDIKRYIGSNERTDDARKEEALRALSLFACPHVAENTALHAVVGFGDTLTPQFWDMTEGNLLATCKTGAAMNYMGCTTALLSLILRFTKEEFRYYLFTDDMAPHYLRKNEHCASSVSALFEGREEYFRSLEKLFDELNYRNALSDAELKQQPFLLAVFGNACRFRGDKEIERFRAMFSLLFRQGKRLRIACMVMTTRFELEFLYHQYKDTFSCFVVGSTYPETAKELLQKDIPDWLVAGNMAHTFLFQDREIRAQIQTYHLALGIGLR